MRETLSNCLNLCYTFAVQVNLLSTYSLMKSLPYTYTYTTLQLRPTVLTPHMCTALSCPRPNSLVWHSHADSSIYDDGTALPPEYSSSPLLMVVDWLMYSISSASVRSVPWADNGGRCV